MPTIRTAIVAVMVLGISVRGESKAYKLTDGPRKVAVERSIVLHDDHRDKDVPVTVYYPVDEGTFPVIVFSHGAGGSQDAYERFGRHWASHSYVSIHPTHADSVKWMRKQTGQGTMRDAVRIALTDPKAWAHRPKDITFVIDSLDTIAGKLKDFTGSMDRKRIGVGGHSFGAYTAQVIGGATIDLPGVGNDVSLADRRVRAVLLFSPQGRGQMGLTDRSWKALDKPVMILSGPRDRGAKGQPASWRKEPFTFAPPGDKYYVFIAGANHFSFCGLGRADWQRAAALNPVTTLPAFLAQQQRITGYVTIASTAFWDAYLKDDAEAKAHLKSDDLSRYSHGRVDVSRK